MPQVSKNRVAEKQWVKMNVKFWELIERKMERGEAEVVFGRLLTETEKMMLVKRMMVWILWKSGWSVPKICQLLKMSHATVYKFQEVYRLDQKFDQTMEKLFPVKLVAPGRKAKGVELVEMVDVFLDKLYEWQHGKRYSM